MCEQCDQDFVAGEDVTHLFKVEKPARTMVLSLRLPIDLFKELEACALQSDRTVSYVARKALESFLHPRIAVSQSQAPTLADGRSTTYASAPGMNITYPPQA